MAPQRLLSYHNCINIGDDGGYPGLKIFLEDRLALNFQLYHTKKDFAFAYGGGWGVGSSYAKKWFEHCLSQYVKIVLEAEEDRLPSNGGFRWKRLKAQGVSVVLLGILVALRKHFFLLNKGLRDDSVTA